MSERISAVGATAGGALVQQLRLTVLGGFDLYVDDEPVRVPLAVQRMLALLALLAVRNRPQSRGDVASTLWMDTTQARATANLLVLRRSVLDAVGDARGLSRGDPAMVCPD